MANEFQCNDILPRAYVHAPMSSSKRNLPARSLHRPAPSWSSVRQPTGPVGGACTSLKLERLPPRRREEALGPAEGGSFWADRVQKTSSSRTG